MYYGIIISMYSFDNRHTIFLTLMLNIRARSGYTLHKLRFWNEDRYEIWFSWLHCYSFVRHDKKLKDDNLYN